MRVVPDSTFLLPLNAPAFGNDISKSQLLNDYQRGDLVVAICPQANPYCSPAADPPPAVCPTPRPDPPNKGYYLLTRYVTTVMPHPASEAGRRGYLEIPNSPMYEANRGLLGQDLALLDVPANVCPGTYELSIRARPVGSAPPYAGEVTTGGGVDLVVLDAPGGAPNPSTANPLGAYDLDIGPDLADLVPDPTLPLRLAVALPTTTYPAAAEIEIEYPPIVEIVGAYQEKHLGIEALVSMRLGPAANRATITVVDPGRCTSDLRIAFRLLTTTRVNVVPLSSPPTPSDFSIVEQRLYDQNGSLISGNFYMIGNPVTTELMCGS
jgi:hypothetical protein